MRLLLDHNVPHGLRSLLENRDTTTAAHLGWEHLRNGELVAAAEREGFDILITGDKNLHHQQRPPRRLSIIVLDTIRWRIVRSAVPIIEHAIATTDVSTPSIRKVDLLGHAPSGTARGPG